MQSDTNQSSTPPRATPIVPIVHPFTVITMAGQEKPPEPAPTQVFSDHPPATAEADSDPDFDDLDDVLDQFSANAPSSSQPIAKEPTAKPEHISDKPSIPTNIPIPSGPAADESEEDFIKRLTAEMSSVMSSMSLPTNDTANPTDLAKMGKELEDFTQKMETEGIKPEDLLKAILGEEAGAKLGDAAHEERDRRESESTRSLDKQPEKLGSFEETIRKTMARMEDSSQKATTATQEKSEEDMLADMLKAIESGGEGGGDLSKMFLGMMEQLTSKDLLYEPMLELHQKFPDWLVQNKSELKTEDYARYARQKEIVKDIVGKFEEKGYSDDDAKCREYIWEKMQKMQEQGAPPEDLVQNPIPGLGGDGPLDEGCPTQ